METTFVYGDGLFRTEAEVNAAVVEMKNRLDSKPTNWVHVKLLSGNADDGWVTPADRLTDDQIINLDVSRYYNVSSITQGVTYTAITGEEANERIWGELRTWFFEFYNLNKIVKTESYEPTNVDMSGYV